MKKLLSILLFVTTLFALISCGGTNAPSGQSAQSSRPSNAAEATPEPSPEASETAAGADEYADSEADDGTQEPSLKGDALIAYFSWSGNTQHMAQLIAEQTGGDLFEIKTTTPYTEDYDALLDIARRELADDARPQLAAHVEDWESYDLIFVGFPNWWNDAPMAVYTFLESYDFSGKTLIPFNTSSSGGFGRSLPGIEESASGATILEGLDLRQSELSDARNRIAQWLNGLGIEG